MSHRYTDRRTVLRGLAGGVAAAGGLTAFVGAAAAHFPDELDVDVTPGSDENHLNPRSRGVTNVAVLATDAFDPTTADVRYRFGPPNEVDDGGGATPVRHRTRDVGGDGRDDLVLQFRTDEAGFDGDDDEAELRWARDESWEHGLSGRDEVTVVGRGRE